MLHDRRAFTLIELLVTISITALLASYMILYGSASRQQITLSIEAAKLAQVVSRAKSLSTSGFSQVSPPCGYGVEVDYVAQKYFLLTYQILPDCKSVYSGGAITLGASTVLQNYSLASQVQLANSAGDALTDVIFVPPDPRVVTNISGALSTSTSGAFYLKTADGTVTKTVKVNAGGQISF